MIDKIKNIINEEIENFDSENNVDTILDEIIELAEQLDPNWMISYIPQGYKHNILDENS